MLKIISDIFSAVLILLTVFIAFLAIKPIEIDSLTSHPNPAPNYKESLDQISALEDKDPPDIADYGRQIVMTHGEKTDRVIVFFHGSTNSPRQFEVLGREFYQLGYNIFIPRIPYHGHEDRMGDIQAKLTAEIAAAATDQAVDIAQGLGEHVTVVGLSIGGNMASWAAQYREDVDMAVIIAPIFGARLIPAPLQKISINLMLTVPNVFVWWDSKVKTELGGPTSAYYRFSTRGLGEMMRLGWCARQVGKNVKPKTPSILFVMNEYDEAINQKNVEVVMKNWQQYDGLNVREYRFEADLKVFHDIIDPEQPYQKISIIYPRLISAIS